MEFKMISVEDWCALKTQIEQYNTEVKQVIRNAINPLQEKWLDNQDACGVLKVSKRTLQNYRDNGTLPFSNLGGKIFYKAADIEAVLDDNYSSK